MISKNGAIFLFAFAIILAIIHTCNSLATAMLVVSLLTNFMVLAICFGKVHKTKQVASAAASPAVVDKADNVIQDNTSQKSDAEEPADEIPAISAFVDMFADKPTDKPTDKPAGKQSADSPVNPGTNYAVMPLYEPTHIVASAYRDAYFSYPSPKLCDVSTQSIDNSNITLSRQRARDRRCTDGWASKTADYYRDNYGTEFADAENSRWWGRHEY